MTPPTFFHPNPLSGVQMVGRSVGPVHGRTGVQEQIRPSKSRSGAVSGAYLHACVRACVRSDDETPPPSPPSIFS